MSNFLYKTFCKNPEHEESTPSCAVYSDGTGFCFGCRTYFKGLDVSSTHTPIAKPKENMSESIRRIKELPLLDHRGLRFHYDNLGYYIVWPCGTYYKRRNWTTSDNSCKYYNPRGYTKPIYFIKANANTQRLLIVEGEINATSVHVCYNGAHTFDILSPGGVGQFTDNEMLKLLPTLKTYSSICIAVDNQDVSVIAALKLRDKLRPEVADVKITLMGNDFNETLVQSGQKEIKRTIKNMGL